MKLKLNEKVIGWAACFMAIAMFTSFIDQILLNLNGTKGSVLMPVAVVVNGIIWVTYSLVKRPTDWPMLAANTVGVLFGAAMAITAYF